MKKKIRLAFINNEYPRFQLSDLGKVPMSGTWSATLSLMREFKKNNIYSKLLVSTDNLKEGNYDAVIVLKNPVMAFECQKKVKETFLWCHETTNSLSYLPFRSKIFFKKFVESGINIVCVSQFQKKQILLDFNFPKDNIHLIPNGINQSWFSYTKNRNFDCTYIAPPNRGLVSIIKIWPLILKQIPDAKMFIISSQKLYGRNDSELENNLISKVKKLPGVIYSKPMGSRRLAQYLLRTKCFVYPSLIAETSSITTLEAKAAGCVIVTNCMGALKESATGNILLKNNSSINTYANKITFLLRNDKVWQQYHKFNISKRIDLSWEARFPLWKKILN